MMSSRGGGTYSQKKKREAVRRLSQQGQARPAPRSRGRGRGRPPSTSPHEADRRRRTLEKRRRPDDDADLGDRRSQRKSEDGRRFISPLNNPDLGSGSTSSTSTASSFGLFGQPTTSTASEGGLFSQGNLATNPTSQPTSLFSSSASSSSSGLFGKPTDSTASPFGGAVQPVFGSFASSTEGQSSVFGQEARRSQGGEDEAGTKPNVKVMFGGDDEAGIGHVVQMRDSPVQERRILSKESSSFVRSGERTTGLFGKAVSSLSQEDSGRTVRSRDKPLKASIKRDLSPSKAASVGSGRTITQHDDLFGGDIADLETFGAAPKVERESFQGRTAVKREGGLFGRALRETAGEKKVEVKRRRGGERSSEESSAAAKLKRTFATQSDIRTLTTIICKDVPEELNNKMFLREFFRKFGTVQRINVNTRRAQATIYFDSHDAAARAKKEVTSLGQGSGPVAIFWAQKDKSRERPSSAGRDENAPPAPSAPREVSQAKTESRSQHKRAVSPTPVVLGRSSKAYFSAVERYEALEERDKQIRKGLTKKSDLATARKMTGTCPDMCPEKERYTREYQRRLSPYEMISGTEKVEKGENPQVDHRRAVKEYSRSSADQEEPLPSELRAPHVLQQTMNYLMAEIMNREPTGPGGDGRSWADWFDFLWNRTRSIRKEITQQQLCGTTAVDLMEKCARFHIYCSYRLCEEGRMAFDPKINNENLTKCLQSLKQFYHDLADEGVFCPNEAEFRAYEVLINLTGGDILREVQQYRPEVRNSEAVVFALRVSSSFSSNNYSRFFKLIRSASFLNACILHRYFVQCRSLALETMSKAFTTPKGVASFPTSELVQLLAFEDDAQAAAFCECHGLTPADGCILLSRSAFFYPEEALTSQRAPSVIEAKNSYSVGEVVNNGPLPTDRPLSPVSSFDEAGRLVQRGLEVRPAKVPEMKTQEVRTQEVKSHENAVEEMQQRQQVVPQEALFSQVAMTTVPPPPVAQDVRQVVEEAKPEISNEVIKQCTKDIFHEVINEMVMEIARMFVAVLVSAPAVASVVINEALAPLSQQVAAEALEEARYAERVRRDQDRRAAEEEAARREREKSALLALRHKVSQELTDEIVETAVTRCLTEIAEQEIREYKQELKQESIERCTSVISNELLQTVVNAEVTDVSHEVIAMAMSERDRKLSEMAEVVHLKNLGKFFQRWCRVHSMRVKIRRALQTFPAAPPNQNAAEQLEVLWPRRRDQGSSTAPSIVEVDAAMKTRSPLPLSLDTPYGVVTERESLAKGIMHHHYLARIRQQRAWAPLDLPTIHRENAHQSQHAHGAARHDGSSSQYWKVVMSLPAVSHDNGAVCDWLKAKLRRGKISDQLRRTRLKDNENVETLSLFTQRASGAQPVGICTKAVTGAALGGHPSQQMMGTSGLILVVTEEGDAETCWREAEQRLDAILSHTLPKPALPILVCVATNGDMTTVQSHMQKSVLARLDSRLEEGRILSWRSVSLPGNVLEESTSEELEGGLAWLAAKHPTPPTVSREAVKEYLDNGLSRYFSTNVHQLSKQRRETGQLPLTPCVIVSLYNSVLCHLAAVARSDTLMQISWPPSEFTSNQHPDLPPLDWNTPGALNRLHRAFHSILLPENLPDDLTDWCSVLQACVDYVGLLPGGNSDKAPLLSRVRWLLGRSRRAFEDTCFMTFDTAGCEPTSQHAPWVDILEECVNYLMSTLSKPDDEEFQPLEQNVYFKQSDLDDFELPSAWVGAMTATLDDTVMEQDSLHQSVMEVVADRHSSLVAEEATERERRRRRKEREILPDNRSFLLPEDCNTTICHTQTRTSRLREILDRERDESQKFEALLSSLLEDPLEGLDATLGMDVSGSEFRLQLPPLSKMNSTREVESAIEFSPVSSPSSGSETTLADDIKSLKEKLSSEKQASLMAEMRLNALLGL